MKLLYADGNTLERVVKVGFDINTPISYEDFISNEMYKDFLEQLPSEIQPLEGNDRNELHGVDSDISMKFDFLLKFDLHESYTGFLTESAYFNFSGEKYAGKQWFLDDQISRHTDLTKAMVTNNRFTSHKAYGDIKQKLGRQILGSPSGITYNEKLTENFHLFYLRFITLLEETPIYIVYNLVLDDFTIVSEDHLIKHLQDRCLTQKTSNMFYLLKDSPIAEKLEQLRKQYKQVNQDPDLLEKMMNDIKKLLSSKEFQTMRGSFYIKEGVLKSMESQINTDNTDFYKWKEKLIDNYNFEARISQGGKPSSARITKKYIYGTDGKNKTKE